MTNFVIRGEITKEQKEVGVEKVIESPENISAMIHEHVGSNDLSLSLMVQIPQLGKIVLLLYHQEELFIIITSSRPL